jgi:hypothetical protein
MARRLRSWENGTIWAGIVLVVLMVLAALAYVYLYGWWK